MCGDESPLDWAEERMGDEETQTVKLASSFKEFFSEGKWNTAVAQRDLGSFYFNMGDNKSFLYAGGKGPVKMEK